MLFLVRNMHFFACYSYIITSRKSLRPSSGLNPFKCWNMSPTLDTFCKLVVTNLPSLRWTISSWPIAPLFWIDDCYWLENCKHRRLWQLVRKVHLEVLHHGLTSVWSLSIAYHVNNWWFFFCFVVISFHQLSLIYDIFMNLVTNTLRTTTGATCAAEIALPKDPNSPRFGLVRFTSFFVCACWRWLIVFVSFWSLVVCL